MIVPNAPRVVAVSVACGGRKTGSVVEERGARRLDVPAGSAPTGSGEQVFGDERAPAGVDRCRGGVIEHGRELRGISGQRRYRRGAAPAPWP